VQPYLADEGEDQRLERAAERSGVGASSAYRWMQQPAFRAYVNVETNRTCLPRWTRAAWNAFERELSRERPNPRVIIKAADMLRLSLGWWERKEPAGDPVDEATRLALGAGLDRIRELMHQDAVAGGRVPADAEFVEEAEDDRGIDELHGHYGQESQPEGKHPDCGSPIPREATVEQAAGQEPFNQRDENNDGNEQPESPGPQRTDEDSETRDRATRADV